MCFAQLHLDYLLAQSSLFRALFSGRSLLDHQTPSRPESPTTPPFFARPPQLSTPPSRLPRILPSSSGAHPVVLLPLPHPESFPHLVHYMYFGTTSVLEDALNKKELRWDDVVRNVEYLGMRTRIKVFLGRWYANWLAPSHSRVGGRPPIVHEEDECEQEDCEECGDDDSSCSDSDSEPDSDPDAYSESDMEESADMEIEKESDAEQDTDEPARGRTRTRSRPRRLERSPKRRRGP